MKKVKITLLMLILSLGYGYSQERLEVQNVDSPYRLLKGPIVMSDLRMSVTVLNGLEENQQTVTSFNHGDMSDGQDQMDKAITIISRNQLTPNPYANQPAIVLDGFLIDNNSPRFIIGQSPFSKVAWRAPF